MDAVGYTEKDGDCTIRFSNDELLVIFDWIAQSNQHENNELDSATQLIFEEFECLLESILAEPFDNDYRLLVLAAKSRIIRETQRGF
ncbi:hypothetical protein HMPREF0742_00779 [Rothia aeria F0184]|uniref:Uncharacterized protein n=3 Tax=Rothia aeria TaxID=172042 RepID=A0A7Z9A2M0_9MICC|nr:hypothetical protein [Rothia aeria]OXT11800.1 hypothetical protein B9K03_05315 [Rothia sp. Olga]EID51229.1 hypothetical protein HMPREF1324_1236 [Rothia aeria F0474]ERT66801.1 hypothetical protein HMPREF0742_00779 [Rothia aeria F0184]QXW93253.1 hypothetical protein LPB401_03640 [Rothia aeria]VEI22927.1 Uncharacterised protein [Rothia aeria]